MRPKGIVLSTLNTYLESINKIHFKKNKNNTNDKNRIRQQAVVSPLLWVLEIEPRIHYRLSSSYINKKKSFIEEEVGLGR